MPRGDGPETQAGVVAASVQELISDAVHNAGTPGFFFLPPLVAKPAFTGALDTQLTPSVVIDRIDPANSAVLETLATLVAGTGSDQVRLETDHYAVNWHTDRYALVVGATYRVRVRVGERELGFADVLVAASQKELKNLATAETIALVDGRTLPIKFRVEVSAGCGPFGAAELVAGGQAEHTVLRGTIVTPAAVLDGEVLVDGDTITCVARSCAAAPTYAQARIVETHGVILPGMIDTHNHVPFNIFDETDWAPSHLYDNRTQWPLEPSYDAMRRGKQYVNGEAGSPVNYSCELNKYGEIKALVSGTTSVATASGPNNQACYGSIARTIDQAQNGLGSDKVVLATFMPNTANADAICASFDDDTVDAYVIHVAEGTDQASRDEFYMLGDVSTEDGCLYAPETAIVHGVALGDAELTTMTEAGMSLVWSPRSNVVLYGTTTDVPLARSKGINTVLAPDWSLTGSQNLLDELRFADAWDDSTWGDQLSPKALTQMVTVNAAAALGLHGVLGAIAPGYKADLMVIGGDRCEPYEALLASNPADVRLVMVAGEVLYGDAALQALGPTSPGCEAFAVCGQPKFLCVATASQSGTDKLGQTFEDIETTLSNALSTYDAAHPDQPALSPIAPVVKCP